MTWGHAIRLLTPTDRVGTGCFKCRARETHEATFKTAGKGGQPLTNRLRFCLVHARAFAERNRLELPAAEPQLVER